VAAERVAMATAPLHARPRPRTPPLISVHFVVDVFFFFFFFSFPYSLVRVQYLTNKLQGLVG
jgi:hypothetical protein